MTSGPNDSAWNEITAQAAGIVAGAGEAGVTLRVLGSAGIRLHCQATGPLMDALDRPVKDIDLLVPEKQRKPMRRYLESLGYVTDRDLLIAMEGTRYCFKHPDGGAELDVFVERLNFCHLVEVRSRLHLHQVTLPIEELLLAKLQIVELTTTDVMDLGVLLATHDIGPVGDAASANTEGGHLLMSPPRRRKTPLSSKHQGSDDQRTIFFASDLHGSEVCFKKFVAAAKFYGADEQLFDRVMRRTVHPRAAVQLAPGHRSAARPGPQGEDRGRSRRYRAGRLDLGARVDRGGAAAADAARSHS
jgi:hypothetical protein